jgi:transcription-repair coupling factor (superfamily II helicase)
MKAFEGTKNIIVESDTDALKLKEMLDTLASLSQENPKEYQIISDYTDILRTIHYSETVGIYTTQTALHPPENTDTKNTHILEVTKDSPLTEKQLIEWLTNNGYETKKTHDEINTYFRQGDTITITSSRGVLQISFF